MKNTKRICTALLLLGATVHMGAQTNPKAGYVITNTGDTIHGTIDYLSASKNAQACWFRGTDEQAFHTYQPGDIRGYRLSDNGIYYVTRTLPVDSIQKIVFAEFLIKGGISLYRYEEDFREYFYLEDNQGRIAEVKNFSTDGLGKDELRETKQRELAQAFDMLKLSEEATNALWNKRIDTRNMLRIARDYNHQFCEEEECIKFQHDEKAARSIVPRLYAGVGISNLWFGKDCHTRDIKHQFAPKVTLGAEYEMPRLSQHFTYHSLFSFLWGKKSGRFSTTLKEGHVGVIPADADEQIEFFGISAELGFTYHVMPKGKVDPLCRLDLLLGYDQAEYSEKNWKVYYQNKIFPLDGRANSTKENNMTAGIGAGVGADFHLGKGIMRVDLHYRHNFKFFSSSVLMPDEVGLRAGWIF